MVKRSFLALCVIAFPAIAHDLGKIVDPPLINLPGGLTAEQVRAVIVAGMKKDHWGVDDEAPGAIVAIQSEHGETARVRIIYDKLAIRITYLDSLNMRYAEKNGVREIHDSYISWVRRLDKDIEAALEAQGQSVPAQPVH